MKAATRSQLAQVIAERTMDESDPKELASEIAAFLLQENKVADLNSLLRDVQEIRLKSGIVEATLVTAHNLESVHIDEIKALLLRHFPKATTVHINTRHDSSVIGGVRIELANEQLDLTVDNKLRTFKYLTGKD
jgi:F0F1-type ATP synthase delta subunit